MGINLFMRRRMAALFFALCLGLFLLLTRLAWVQLVQGHKLESQAMEARLRKVTIPAKRGKIFDRQMRELAVSVSAPSVVVFPPEVKLSGRAQEIAAKLASILGMPEQEVYQKITKNALYYYVRRKIGFAQADQIAKLKLPGIEIIEENQRYYPSGPLAANVIGFAGIDNQGLEGIEFWYNQELQGQNGSLRVEADAVGREIPQATHSYEPPQDGYSLVLTIDSTIQYLAEQELEKLMQSPTAPAKASIVIMDPRTGEILAMATRPSFDPNQYSSYPASTWRNPVISDAYEPGSTFKIITAAAALEEGLVQETEKFYCPGYIKVGKQSIKCWRFPLAHGSETFAEGVKNSCNPVFVSLGLRLYEKNPAHFYDYIHAFGFGARTGIDLSGEATGQLVPQEKLRDIYVGPIAMGQSVAVTPIQLVTAVGAVANSGLLVRPHLVKEIRDREGNLVRRIDPQPVRQVISRSTASRLSQLLEGVVQEDGTGANAYVPGYRVAGKTGTAQKPGPGGYMAGKFVASFVGFAPANTPRLVGLVVIDEPKGYPYFGGTIAAPIFQRLTESTLRYLAVPVAEKVAEEEETELGVPQVLALPVKEAVAILEGAGFKAQVVGGGDQVRAQTPRGGAFLAGGGAVLLDTKGGPSRLVPDLTGLSYSQALNRLSAVGLGMTAVGSGEVVEQEPVPYSEVPAGQKVTVTLKEVTAETTLAP